MAGQPPTFTNVDTAADDTCIIAFTSGTTGVPKATMHFHRDVMAICACFPPHVLRARADDVFIGSPPLAFTFGLGGLLLFPMTIGASTVLAGKAGAGCAARWRSRHFGATVMLHRADLVSRHGRARPSCAAIASLRKCVSAGEALPAATRALWKDATGIELIDGIGATELLHIFISADEAHARPGATGMPVPGLRRAAWSTTTAQPVPAGTVGRLAVKGPTGCRYLADDRQRNTCKDGWNYTGDAYLVDEDGYFHFQSRTDDMIISAGYNIASPEVEGALSLHPKVAECGGRRRSRRGARPDREGVRRRCGRARGRAPSVVEGAAGVRQATPSRRTSTRARSSSCEALPRTETGKLQRFKLRQDA